MSTQALLPETKQDPTAAAQNAAAMTAAKTIIGQVLNDRQGQKLDHVIDVIFVLCHIVELVAVTLSGGPAGIVLGGASKLKLACDLAVSVVQALFQNGMISQATNNEVMVIAQNVNI